MTVTAASSPKATKPVHTQYGPTPKYVSSAPIMNPFAITGYSEAKNKFVQLCRLCEDS